MNPIRARNDDDFPLLTGAACVLCVTIWLVLNLHLNDAWAQPQRWGYVSEMAIFRGAYWGQVTMAFVHQEIIHLAFNVYWLWILGGALERRIGSIPWLVFVLTAAFVSSGVQLASGENGIGMSGVGYALFGFGWMTRRRFAEFARLVNDKTVQMFIGWGIFCVVATYAHFLNVANLAHLGGLLFGAAVGGMIGFPKYRWAQALGLTALFAVAVGSLVWNPRSVDWVSEAAYNAAKRHDYPTAIRYCQQVIQMGGNEEWAYTVLASIYEQQGQKELAKDAKDHLAQYKKDGSQDVTSDSN